MRARAEVSVELGANGHTRVWLQSQAPLVLRRTGSRSDTPCVHLLGGAGGPLGGDDLTLVVRVGPGAVLQLRSVAAMIAQPDRERRLSLSIVEADLAEDATLDWAPEPLIVTRNARHQQFTSVKLNSGSTVRWRDVTVLGRHEQEPGTVEQRLTVTYGAVELLAQTQTWGPQAPRGWNGPAGIGKARVVASLLHVSPHPLPSAPAPTPSAATLDLARGGQLRTAIGFDVPSVLHALEAAPTRHPTSAFSSAAADGFTSHGRRATA